MILPPFSVNRKMEFENWQTKQKGSKKTKDSQKINYT